METACLLPPARGPYPNGPREGTWGEPVPGWLSTCSRQAGPTHMGTAAIVQVSRYATLSSPPPLSQPARQCRERNALYIGPVDRAERGHTITAAWTFPRSRRVLASLSLPGLTLGTAQADDARSHHLLFLSSDLLVTTWDSISGGLAKLAHIHLRLSPLTDGMLLARSIPFPPIPSRENFA